MPESEPAAERVVTELAGMPQPARRHQLRTAMAAARSSPRVCVGGGGGGGGPGACGRCTGNGGRESGALASHSLRLWRAIVYGYGEI